METYKDILETENKNFVKKRLQKSVGEKTTPEIAERVIYAISHLTLDERKPKPKSNSAPTEEPNNVKGLLPARLKSGRAERNEVPSHLIMDWDQLCRARSDQKEQGTLPETEQYIYSISPEGEVRFAKDTHDIKHPDLDCCRPSSLAGEICFDNNYITVPKSINQKSGHYRHDEEALIKGCHSLYNKGILHKKTKIVGRFIKKDASRLSTSYGTVGSIFKL